MKNLRIILSLTFLLTGAVSASAATDEEKCLTKRISATAKYEACVGKVISALVAGDPLDADAQAKLTKCRLKYDSVWAKLTALTDSTTCGGKPRFSHSASQTVTDNLSGRVWEKKDDGLPYSDKDVLTTWSTGTPFTSIGTAFTSFLDGTSGTYTGTYHDWRLPTIAELLSIVSADAVPCAVSPCVAAAFNTACTVSCYPGVGTCSCTQPYQYWTAIDQGTAGPTIAWTVDFGTGNLTTGFKTVTRYARAVRGGLY